MIYQWGSRRFGIDPQAAGDLIAGLAKEHGGACPPDELVKASAPDDALCHDAFTWDDPEAAHRWRKHEAREVINSLRVIHGEPELQTVPPPAFLHVRVMDDGVQREGYMAIQEVRERPDAHKFVVQEALSSLSGHQRRYSHIAELSPVWSALDEVRSKIEESDD